MLDRKKVSSHEKSTVRCKHRRWPRTALAAGGGANGDKMTKSGRRSPNNQRGGRRAQWPNLPRVEKGGGSFRTKGCAEKPRAAAAPAVGKTH